ncbi:MAG: PBSX family phage terminase large subunit [Ruminococcaceae bacterium]|jgi:PBSX family phage terminase large subunit|nr:PBSX family phage terminase large subunit [Oscillospiraceae bacterium]
MSFSEKQRQILTFPYSGFSSLICDGAVRAGKTCIMSLSFVLWAMGNFSGQNFGICGKTVVSAERNIIRPLMGIRYLQQHFKIHFANHVLTVSRGDKTNLFYIFGGKDESSYQLIQGITLAGVLLDEVALMPESFVNQALARCSVDDSKYWFNCNPEGPQHWFYQNWILKPEKHNALHLHFLLDDNPSLSEEKKQEYYSSYTGVFYDRYIRGLWVVAEGRVYPMFTDSPNSFIRHESLAGIDGQWFVSMDYGTANPTAMQLWCVQDHKATMVHEYYYDSRKVGSQKTDEEYYAELEKLTDGYYIRKVIVDPSAASFIECIRRHGKFRVWEADNNVLDGIRVTSSFLHAGMLQFHESCKDTIREFGLYRWDDDKNDDTVIKENDHAMDAMRYFCYTVLAREFRWADWR